MDGSDSKKEFPFVIEKRHVPNVASEIFKFLDQKTLLKARVVCKEWKHQVDKKTALWKEFNCKSYKNVASPLHAAAWSGNVEMCKLLLENCDRRHSILIGDDTGQSPLHYAGQATYSFFLGKNIDTGKNRRFDRRILDWTNWTASKETSLEDKVLVVFKRSKYINRS